MSAHHHERTRQDVGGDDRSADVIVVGAGPAGSTAATYLARAGLDVLVLEKSEFPREKVCGDGLTPRAVKQLIDLGIDTREEAGWLHNKGLRVLGGGLSVELPWPELTSFPPYGLVRPRRDISTRCSPTTPGLRARASGAGRRPGAVTDERTGRVVGCRRAGARSGAATYTAPLVVACDGVGARTRACPAGHRQARRQRPLGVAVRRTTPAPEATTTTSRPSWSSGPSGRRSGAEPERVAADRLPPATAGCSGWATGRSTSGSASWTQSNASGPTTAACSRAGCETRRGVGPHRGERGERHRRGRPADGLQPHARTTPRPAAGR